MLLKELAAGQGTIYGGETAENCEISRIENDSRRVVPGDLFVCVNGTFRDGHVYAQSAVDAGAVALLTEHKLPIDIPQVVVPNSRIAMAEMAAKFYNYPTRGIPVVGITGTNGKTTTTYMLKYIAERAGYKVGLVGTIRNLIGDREIPTDRTTPESIELQRIFRIMRDEGVDLIIMEVSSHALDQHRVHGIEFTVAGFTNLTQDHLDYHKSFENYFNAKRKLFEHCSYAVVNVDDSYGKKLLEGLNVAHSTYGICNNSADVIATEIDIHPNQVAFTMIHSNEETRICVNIPGLFNVFNAMLAASIAMKLGISNDDITAGLAGIKGVSGRMEALHTEGFDFTVLLDFAHTPDGLVNLLTSVQEFAKGRVITVFGCGGDRDNRKRPIMGEMGARYSDFCVITSDNPRTEDPNKIIDMVLEGVQKTACPYIVIENRREAIKYALHMAKKDDVIVLAGKGHENYQEINGVKHPFDEKIIVEDLLDEMRN